MQKTQIICEKQNLIFSCLTNILYTNLYDRGLWKCMDQTDIDVSIKLGYNISFGEDPPRPFF